MIGMIGILEFYIGMGAIIKFVSARLRNFKCQTALRAGAVLQAA